MRTNNQSSNSVLIMLFIAISVYTNAQTGLKKMVIYDKQLDFTTGNTVSTLPISFGTTNYPISNSLYGSNGNNTFCFAQDAFYDAAYTAYPYLLNTYTPNVGEIVVCPYPCVSSKYIIFYPASGTDLVELWYRVIDFSSTPPTYGAATLIKSYPANNSEFMGLALSKTNSASERYLYVVTLKDGLDRVTINAAGNISAAVNISSKPAYPSYPLIAEADLNATGTKFGYLFGYCSKCIKHSYNRC